MPKTFAILYGRKPASVLPPQTEVPTQVVLPLEIGQLASFLKNSHLFGKQVAFLRGKGKRELLTSAALTMRSILADPNNFALTSAESALVLPVFEQILADLNRFVEAIPFRRKVGFVRRNLIATFHQVYVLRHLCQAIICKLQLAQGNPPSRCPAGSPMDLDAKRYVRDSFRSVVGSGWDKEEWRVYDYL